MIMLIETGKIVNTHGIHGDVKVVSWSKDPETLLAVGKFYIDGAEYTVEKSRVHKGSLLIKFTGIRDMTSAERLKNKVVYADRDDFILEESEYFIEDIIGMTVLDIDTGKNYGKIFNVIQTGANDVYEIRGEDGTERLIPAIADCVIETDVSNSVMKIRPLEGLFDI